MINYCFKSSYLLMVICLGIIGGGNLFGQKPLCECSVSPFFHVNSEGYTVNANTSVWTQMNNPISTGSNPRINGDLVIPNGVQLTIDGMTLEFGMKGRVIVEQGGELKIIRATFTGDDVCTTMWQGIQVHGAGFTGGQAPTASNTGRLFVENSIIEHAIVGVANREIAPFNMNGIGTTDYGDIIANGTITSVGFLRLDKIHGSTANQGNGFLEIKGVNTVFRDCFYGVYLGESDALNNSFNTYAPWHNIKETLFTNSGNLRCPLSNNTTEAGIATYLMLGFSEVDIYNCDFQNLKHGWYSLLNVSQESTFNDFNNCNRGISTYGLGTYSYIKFDILTNHYMNCQTAIQATSTNINILASDINATTLTFGDRIGALLRGCSFLASTNEFTNIYLGILSLDNDQFFGEIKRNVFQNNYVGAVAGGDNFGVQILCNDFNNYLVYHPLNS